MLRIVLPSVAVAAAIDVVDVVKIVAVDEVVVDVDLIASPSHTPPPAATPHGSDRYADAE